MRKYCHAVPKRKTGKVCGATKDDVRIITTVSSDDDSAESAGK